MELAERIRGLSEHYFEEVRDLRQHLHRNPEPSFQEHQTARHLAQLLGQREIPFQEGWVETGIVGHIKGAKEGPTVALRGDMDALPIQERNDRPYSSVNDGLMHACGHDVHSSCLFGAALILRDISDELDGSVRLLFQPGEEQNPGGASRMIEQGALRDPSVSGIYGQHVFPDLEVGKVGFRSGPYMASTDEVRLRVKGKGGHAAIPERNVDPVLIGSHIITSLQQLVSRNADPTVPSVLSFGKVEAAGANNVIPDEMYLEGTFRTFDEAWRDRAHQKIQRMAEGVADSMGGACEVMIEKGYPYLVNDPELTERSKAYASELLGSEQVVELPLRMTAEDFAYYSQVVPGCFYRLGVRNEEKGIVSGLHTPTFDIDETALKTGMATMAWSAYRFLKDAG